MSVDDSGDVTEIDLWWELEAQIGVQRELPRNPPRGDFVVLGIDSSGIAAVAWWTELSGAGSVKFLLAAVALRLRGSGEHVGDQLMEEVHRRLVERIDGTSTECVMVHGLVHGRNTESQSMLSRQRWWYAQDVREYQEWWARLQRPA